MTNKKGIHQPFSGIWWSFAAWTVFVIAVVYCFLVFSGKAEASEFRLGYAPMGNHGKMIGDGVWVQSGLDNKIENDQPAYSLTYVGNTHTSWLDYSLGLHYLRGPKASGEYLRHDECYNNRVYSGGNCNDRDFASMVSSETFGVSFTVNPTWRVNKDLAFSSGIGGRLFYTVVRVEFDRTRGASAYLVCDEPAKYREIGITPYAELSATYKRVFATGYYAKDEGAANAMSSANYGLMVGYRHIL